MAWSSRAGAIQIAGTPKAGSRASLPASGRRFGIARDGQQLRSLGLPAADLHAAQAENRYSRGLRRRLSRDMHRGHQKAHLRGEMAAQRAHPAQQLPALLLVHQRNQLKADLQGQLFQAQQVGQIRALRLAGLLLLAHPRLGRRSRRRRWPPRAARPRTEPPATIRKASLGSPGIRHIAAETRLATIERDRLGQQLLANLAAQQARPSWRGSA